MQPIEPGQDPQSGGGDWGKGGRGSQEAEVFAGEEGSQGCKVKNGPGGGGGGRWVFG